MSMKIYIYEFLLDFEIKIDGDWVHVFFWKHSLWHRYLLIVTNSSLHFSILQVTRQLQSHLLQSFYVI